MPKKAASRPPKSAADARKILAKLERQHPGADTELHFTTPYELLVATILSAQCTDERVNRVTPALFARYPNAAALHEATTAELEPQIQSTGFFRAKSKSLAGMAAAVCERHGGDIPKTMDELTGLPGVGRKTANVVLGHALGVPGLPVDRHVLRVSNRIGIGKGDDPEVVEQQLCTAMPRPKWTKTSDTLIIHGRRICKPRPLCDQCAVRDDCDYYRKVIARQKAPAAASEGRRVVGAKRRPRARSEGGAAPGPRPSGVKKAPAAASEGRRVVGAKRRPRARSEGGAAPGPRPSGVKK